MLNLNVRELDPPTHSGQFDINCGKIRYMSDLSESCSEDQKVHWKIPASETLIKALKA